MAEPTSADAQPQQTSDLADLFLQKQPTPVVPEADFTTRSSAPYVDPWKMSVGETYDRVAEMDHTVPAAIRMIRNSGYEPDGWQMPAQDSDEFKQLTQGIPGEKWPSLFSAVSLKQATDLSNEIRGEDSTEQLLAEHGAGGLGARLLFDATDPVALARVALA